MGFNTITKVGRTVVKFTKHYAPEILLGLGVVGSAGTAATIYKSRPEIEKVLDEHERKVRIYEMEGDQTSKEDLPSKINLVKGLLKAGTKPVILGFASMACFAVSYKIQSNRITTLVSSLSIATTQINRIKATVKNNTDEETYKKIMSPLQKREVTYEKDGEEVTAKKNVKVQNNLFDGFWYSDSDEYVSDDHDYNLQYVLSVISRLELIAFNKGAILVNEVLEAFSVDKTRQGALLGWSDSNFDISHEVFRVWDEEEGEYKVQIYIHWSTPEYIYNKISYDNSYYLA